MRKIFVCFLTIGLLLSGCFHKEVVDLSGEKAVVEQTKFDEFLKQEFILRWFFLKRKAALPPRKAAS